MPDLITLSRAVQNATLAAVAASSPAYLASLITAASDEVRRKCGRDFTLGAYTEYHSGGIYVREPLRLRQFPVAQITRIAATPLPALHVRNVDPIGNQRATVETTATGVRLSTVASAALAQRDLAFADYPTLASLAAAINAAGNGWSATVWGDFGNWPTADFNPLQGAVTALAGGADLELYRETVPPFTGGPIALDDDCAGATGGAIGWRLDAETGELFGRFPRGQLNIRIDYRAGFSAIPQAVQEATTQLAQDLYQASLVNSTLKKATLGAASVELKNTQLALQMSPKVELLLAPYRDFAKTILR